MINNSSQFIDLHQDLLAHIHDRETCGQNEQTDFTMIEKFGPSIVVATAFPLPADENYLDPKTEILIEADLRGYRAQCESSVRWKIILNASDIDLVMSDQNARALVMHVEGMNTMTDSPESWKLLQRWHEIGLRSVGIVWNVTNSLGGGTKDSVTGLSRLGMTVVQWLLAQRMVVDLAHANEPTFWGVASIMQQAGRPLYISHGNCCSLCENPRNYSDTQLRAVAESGGVVGAFFAKTFVTGRELSGNVEDIANHIDYMRRLMGIDHCAIGSDFGGIITGTLEGLQSLEDMPALWAELVRRGYSDSDIEKIAWRNAARVLKEYL